MTRVAPTDYLPALRALNHISKGSLRVVLTDTGVVVETLFEAEGTLGKRASAHITTTGAFVLDLTMTTGFDQAETTVVLWTAPDTEGRKGTYVRQAKARPYIPNCTC